MISVNKEGKNNILLNNNTKLKLKKKQYFGDQRKIRVVFVSVEKGLCKLPHVP